MFDLCEVTVVADLLIEDIHTPHELTAGGDHMWLCNKDLLLSVLTLNLVHICTIIGGEGLDELGIAPEGQSEFVLRSLALLEGSLVPLQFDLQERPRNSTLNLVYRACHVSTVAGHFVEEFEVHIVTVCEDVELLVVW